MAWLPFEGQRQTKDDQTAARMSESTPTRNVHWRRALRPLIWWGIMVLLMFAYRTHERLSANTTITFAPLLEGKSVMYESQATIDGKPIRSGQRNAIGWHTLTVSHPKTKSFTTNLLIWYGENDLGQIALERATGLLAVRAAPAAPLLTIRGPEFSRTLTNTLGLTSSVPTDSYAVEARYTYWQQRETVGVRAGETMRHSFAPKLGTLHIEASHADTTFQLRDGTGRQLDSGALPVTLAELPEGNYQLTARRKRDQRDLPVMVNANATNSTRVEFVYGAGVIESVPFGAVVYIGGSEAGITPLTLPELNPGNFEFTLKRTDYEPVITSLRIVANQTTSLRTNLVSRFYTGAMERANRLYATKEFNRAAEATMEALKHKPDDPEAMRLRGDATGQALLARAETLGSRGDYVAAIKEITTALEFLSDGTYAQALAVDFTQREQERIEAENKRQAELVEQTRKREEAEQAARRRQQSINRLNTRFNEMNRAYSSSETFARHEIVATNGAQSAATKINSALVGGQPSFEIVKYEWPDADTFTIQARHKIGLGYRECLIVGGNVHPGEMQVLYKVFEYENPPELKLLGGFLTAASSVKITSQDPQVEQRKGERFQERIKDGLQIVRNRIKNSFGN